MNFEKYKKHYELLTQSEYSFESIKKTDIEYLKNLIDSFNDIEETLFYNYHFDKLNDKTNNYFETDFQNFYHISKKIMNNEKRFSIFSKMNLTFSTLTTKSHEYIFNILEDADFFNLNSSIEGANFLYSNQFTKKNNWISRFSLYKKIDLINNQKTLNLLNQYLNQYSDLNSTIKNQSFYKFKIYSLATLTIVSIIGIPILSLYNNIRQQDNIEKDIKKGFLEGCILSDKNNLFQKTFSNLGSILKPKQLNEQIDEQNFTFIENLTKIKKRFSFSTDISIKIDEIINKNKENIDNISLDIKSLIKEYNQELDGLNLNKEQLYNYDQDVYDFLVSLDLKINEELSNYKEKQESNAKVFFNKYKK